MKLNEFLETISPDANISVHYHEDLLYKGNAGELIAEDNELQMHLDLYEVEDCNNISGLLYIHVI